MRIMIAGTFVFPEGAAGRAVHMQAKGLAEAGHDVEVVACRSALQQRQATLDSFSVKCFDHGEEQKSGLSRRLHWMYAQFGMLHYLLVSVWGQRFDCIMFYGVAPVFAFVAPIARILRQRTCLIQYDIEKTTVFLGFLDYLRRQLAICSEKVLARTSSLIIIGYSSALEDDFRRMAPQTPRVKVWPPTDTAFFACGSKERARSRLGVWTDRLVVYAGSISRLEGVDVLLQAIPTIVEQCPKLKLVIAGSVASYDPVCGRPIDYEEMAWELRAGANVVFTGMLPADQVVDLLAAADCLVIPKVDHPANSAASPIKMGEYLASGRPVVATRVSELDTWLRHSEDVWFCRPGDPVDLAAGIVCVLADDRLAKKLGTNGGRVARYVCDYHEWARRVEDALGVV